MLKLLEINPSRACHLDVSEGFVPISLGFKSSNPDPNFYLRFGDGDRRLTEVQLTTEGYVLGLTVVAHRAADVTVSDAHLDLTSSLVGFPRFEVTDLYRLSDEWSDRFVDVLTSGTKIILYPDSCGLILFDVAVVQYVENDSVFFGLSEDEELVSLRIKLEPDQVLSLRTAIETAPE